MAPPPLQQHLEVVLSASRGCGLTQLDLAKLLCVSHGIREVVQRTVFHKDRPLRPWLDAEGRVWPQGRLIVHPVLAPLVLIGNMRAEDSLPSEAQEILIANCRSLKGPDIEEYQRRVIALSLVAQIDDRSRAKINELLSLRVFAQLTTVCSCGAIWSCALGLLKASSMLDQSPNLTSSPTNPSLFALLGLEESIKPAADNAPADGMIGTFFKERGSIRVQVRGHAGRTRSNQWEICQWLWHEARNRRNHNVRVLLKQCKKRRRPGHSQPLLQQAWFVDQLVSTPLRRSAISDGSLQILRLQELGARRGKGHVEEVLTIRGIEGLRAGDFTLDELAQVPKSRLVQLVCNNPGIVQASDVISMRAPETDRGKMIELVLRRESAWSPYVRVGDLLRLPTLTALEFALSTYALSGLKRGLLDLSTLDTFGQTSAKASSLLRVCLNSDAGEKLLAEKVITVPKLLEHVTKIGVLSVLLGDLGSAALRSGRLRLDDLEPSMTARQLLQRLQGKELPPGKRPAEHAVSTTEALPPPRKRRDPRAAASCALRKEANSEDGAGDGADDVLEPNVNLMVKFCSEVHENVTEDEARYYLMRNDWVLHSALRDYKAAEKERAAGVDCLHEASGGRLPRKQARAFLFQHDWDVSAALDNLDDEIKARSAAVSHWSGAAAQDLHDAAPKRSFVDLLRESRANRQAAATARLVQQGVVTGDLAAGPLNAATRPLVSARNASAPSAAAASTAALPTAAAKAVERKSSSSIATLAQSLAPASMPRRDTPAYESGLKESDDAVASGSAKAMRRDGDDDYNLESQFDDGQCLLNGPGFVGDPAELAASESRTKVDTTPATQQGSAAADDFESVLNGGGPTRKQLDTLLRFMDVSGAQTEDYSVSVLRMCDWNLDLAVQTHLASLAPG